MTWPIDDASMALLAAVDVAAMPSVCRIGRRTLSVASGRVNYGSNMSYSDSLPCRLSGVSVVDGVDTQGRVGEQTSGTLTVPLGTDVVAGDWVEVTTTTQDTDTTLLWEIIGYPVNVTYQTSLSFQVRRAE